VSSPKRALLLPKLRRYFAEFLNHGSLDRLSILYLITCVGFGYGRYCANYEAFLGSIGSMTSPNGSVSRLKHMNSGFAYRSSYTLTPGQPTPGLIYLPASPLSCPPRLGRFARKQPLSTTSWNDRIHSGTGISTSCASTTPLGLALAPDSPWAD
jgi:hypothetical protein